MFIFTLLWEMVVHSGDLYEGTPACYLRIASLIAAKQVSCLHLHRARPRSRSTRHYTTPMRRSWNLHQGRRRTVIEEHNFTLSRAMSATMLVHHAHGHAEPCRRAYCVGRHMVLVVASADGSLFFNMILFELNIHSMQICSLFMQKVCNI